MNIPLRISQIRHKIRSKKASYPIAASLVKFKSKISPIYKITGGDNRIIHMRVRFTSEDTNAAIFSQLSAQVSVDPNNFSLLFPRSLYRVEPQREDGTIDIDIFISTPRWQTDYYVRVIASGAVDGTFERIQ